ncbi:MAG: hypothetical protein A3I77_07285 [Gammaproteobacteria bacterium RIFCSPLOWO2_02_FULL_42_14]|nr:MAG: hypothetical protein A3B71_03120 [Gammaproteobacteria bacterium RIFCSPHIGHO2_02_FULL_42_43]OGT29138.1 MAG: hypothetical protein A2624_04240 [Gammaproteobacteria bacterium RIFCSPHIGHO2_01_FULL_42_8]OGT52478.1 MAG: hypothetical protein A3E54_00600 [Gammaproteobacteria bacterium RIFCSPHIGHO2_12_FULL_41_25]OGT61160.1 MAG: hypothetical protein A3I77_07285 [Gammaproteobacteria bacterium RIFCSPLOWO2_02_FULL_42_14]OGT87088.1 MAG: hypothetical protein A3G86_01005 [Gammaproteobacteria bacterium R
MRRDSTQVTRIVKLFVFIVAATMVSDIFSKVVSAELETDSCNSDSIVENIDCLTNKLVKNTKNLVDNVNKEYERVRDNLSPEKRSRIERLQQSLNNFFNKRELLESNQLKALTEKKKQARNELLSIAKECMDLIDQTSDGRNCPNDETRKIVVLITDKFSKFYLSLKECVSIIEKSDSIDHIKKELENTRNKFLLYKNALGEVTYHCGFQR